MNTPALRLIDPYFLTIGEGSHRVLLALAIAILATFVALDLAGRVQGAIDRVSANLWILAGSIAMGTGIWSMHFVGMSAAAYPFKAGYEIGNTVFSWFIAVGVSGVLLHAAEAKQLRTVQLWGRAAVVGAGLCGMHFVGMRALVIFPAPSYYLGWALAALVCSVCGCAAALRMVYRLRRRRGWQHTAAQFGAAVVFGGSIAAMHFLAMAAVDFAQGTVCTSSDGLDVRLLGGGVALASVGFLLLMLLITALERRTERHAQKLVRSLDQAQQELAYITFNDPVTGLPNRLVFQDRLQQAVHRASQTGRSLAVLMIEIDGFRATALSLGSAETELLLEEAGRRLVKASGTSGAVACVGGHQFLLLIDAIRDTDAAIAVAERVVLAFQAPITLGARHMRVSASIGVTTYPADGAPDKLANNASVAVQAASGKGGNCYAFFESTMDEDAHVLSEWLQDLRLAVSRNELELHYQPKVQAQSWQIAGVEALLRWRHPTRGMVGPMVFIPLAERFGLINELGDWVINEACRQMADWAECGLRVRVAINISVFQLRQANLATTITQALDRHAIDPGLLTCEITESGAMEDTLNTLTVFQTLQALGVQIAIDDFGTGYSSLSYLRKMPVCQLKIDRSFVKDLGTNEDARSVVAAIIDLAHALRLEVVAEGVETEGQRDVLLSLRCDKLQGYLFAKPMPADEFRALAFDAADGARRFKASTFTSIN